MATSAHTADYNFDARLTTPGAARAKAPGPRTAARPATGGLEECLQLLARAVQQFHTYPPTSTMCVNAVEACQRALAAIEAREHVAFRVTPHEAIVDEVAVGRGTLIEPELARRLHAASVAEVTIERTVAQRELSRFCQDLIRCGERGAARVDLIELLAEHGVERIVLRPAYRPEVLNIGPAAPTVAALIEQQRKRREESFAAGGAVNHLYPPDKGWVRVDPSAPFQTISLLDLALLAEDPAALASMLLRLTDEESADELTEGAALAQKFSDVTMLFSSLDPGVARVMFSRLAHAVLDLEPDRRQALLRRTILPGLIDGRNDGLVLRDFPNLELADSLCLLLDLETAAPEVVTTALTRLQLPPERHAAVVPLLEERLQGRGGRPRDVGIEAHARKLVRVDHQERKSFAEFAAFDLAVDPHTEQALAHIREAIDTTDVTIDQLECLWRLTRLEPNPETAQRFLDRAAPLVEQLQHEERWPQLAGWFTRYRELAESLRESRPDVADVVAGRLAAFCTPARAARLIDLAGREGDGRAVASMIIEALGAAIGPSLAAAIERDSARGRNVGQLLCDHARIVAPGLAPLLGTRDASLDRTIVRVLGLAGHGYETALGAVLASKDEQTVREALRSLARIGTPHAAALVRAAVEQQKGWMSLAAEETLWHFPAGEAHRQVRDLLNRREFVLRFPVVAARLLDRAAQAGAAGLESALQSMVSLRYRIWSPSLVRVGRKARAMLAS